MNFNRRLLLCAVVPSVLFVAALATSVLGLARTQSEFDRYTSTEQATATGLAEMYAQGLQMGQALRNIVLDPAGRKAYDNLAAAEEAYERAYAETLKASRGSAFGDGVASLKPLRDVHGAKQKSVLTLIKSDPAAAIQVLKTEETPAWRDLRGKLMEQVDTARKQASATHEATQERARSATLVSALFAVFAAGVAGVLCWLSRRTVDRELGGDPAHAREALRHIADGDLTFRLEQRTGSASNSLMSELRRTQQRLQDLVSQVRTSTDSIHTASAEIATGNLDLSQRTEQTASSLQQTASSMEQLTVTVKQAADSARQANQLAMSAADVAKRGGQVVSEVVSTMNEINASSKKIADIIGVIDGIAFQTNILALNAAVEAARAGEQGRGFAVVASEVRNLAHRSAEAAKEIKLLIGASVEKVEGGAKLVTDAGKTMDEIVASVKRVTDVVGEITAASAEQSDGIGQVNVAITQLDRMTQQNAALVEESAAAAESLKDQGARLSEIVGTFRLHA